MVKLEWKYKKTFAVQFKFLRCKVACLYTYTDTNVDQMCTLQFGKQIINWIWIKDSAVKDRFKNNNSDLGCQLT